MFKMENKIRKVIREQIKKLKEGISMERAPSPAEWEKYFLENIRMMGKEKSLKGVATELGYLKEGDIKNAIADLMQQMGVDKAIWEPKTHLLDKSIQQKSDWKEKLGALSTWIADVTGGGSTSDTSTGDKGSEKFGSSHIGMKPDTDDKPSSTNSSSTNSQSAVTT